MYKPASITYEAQTHKRLHDTDTDTLTRIII
jgi:hypothetical protein